MGRPQILMIAYFALVLWVSGIKNWEKKLDSEWEPFRWNFIAELIWIIIWVIVLYKWGFFG